MDTGRMVRILLVDDRPTNLEYLCTLVNFAGHQSLEASDGSEALAIARREQPDLIITDILMPTMNGYELVEQLRGIPELASVPVIFYTASYSTPEAERLALACGAFRVLAKPAEPEVVLEAIAAALGADKPAVMPLQAAAQARQQHGLTALFQRYEQELQILVSLLESRENAEPPETSAIRHARTDSVRRLGEGMHRVVELSMQLSSERSPLQILDRLLATVSDLVSADAGAICAIDPSEPGSRHVRSRGGIDGTVFADASSDRIGLLRPLVRENRVLRLDDAGGIQGLPPGHPPCTGLLGAPLTTQTDTVGWMYFTRRWGTEPFGDHEEFIVSTMASAGALFYEAAHVYDVMQRHAARLQLEVSERRRAEAQIKRLNRVLGVLSSIDGLIVRTRDRATLLDGVCRIAVKDGEFAYASIDLVEGDEIRLCGFQCRDPKAATGLAAAREVADVFIRAALAEMEKNGEPLVVDEDTQSALRPELRAWLQNAGIKSTATLPLRVEGQIVGMLNFGATEAGFFRTEELASLEELGRNVAFAMASIEREERLGFLEHHDTLTGLADRRLFDDRVGQHLAGARGTAEYVGLLVLDIDRFKTLNDRFGYARGDDILREIAERLKRIVGDVRWLARMSGDRFAALVPNLSAADDLMDVLGNLTTALEQPFTLTSETEALRLGIKIGVAIYPGDGDTAEELIRNAEEALKRAKDTGERYLFHTAQISNAIRLRQQLEGRLERALRRQEFVLHYQAQINLATGRINGAEALLRWQDPELGLVPPGRFIPLLEETGMIVEVGRWVLEQALRDRRAWLAAGLSPPPVAVNVSALQLRQPQFIAQVREALGLTQEGIAHGIEIEVTESLMVGNADTNVAKLHALREMGVAVAIDDFGTGFSSLGYLARLPVNTIKIDRSFIAEITENDRGLNLVSGILRLAHSLNLNVVAEGVETRAQLALLRELGCEQLQGYLFRPAVPAAEFATMLREGHCLTLD